MLAILDSLEASVAGGLAQGRRFLTPFWAPFVVLLCFHQLFYGWILVQSNFVPYVMDGNETFSVFWHAHNLYNYSFWKSLGLTDESFSTVAAAHPFFHTHQGNMPRLFGFLIYVLGARTVPAQVLITVLVIGNLTLFFCYAFLARVTRPLIAFLFCMFLFSDYLLYAQWHVVTYRIWYGFLFFGTLFAISHAQSRSRLYHWPFVLLGGLFFLLFYFELVFAIYVSIVCGSCGIWLYWRQPSKIGRLYLAQAIGGSLALLLLFVQLVSVFGLDVVATDFRETFLARNASTGSESIAVLRHFYQDSNIVFWENFRNGQSLRTLGAIVRSLGVPIFQVWTPTFFLLIAGPFLGILISNIERTPAKQATGVRSADLGSKRDGRYALFFYTLFIFTYAVPITLVLLAVSLRGAVFGLPPAEETALFEALFGASILTVIFSAAGLVDGWRSRNDIEVKISRGLLMGSLMTLLIANNGLLYDQNYSDIWLNLFERVGARPIVRLIVFLAALAGIIVAVKGAGTVFGEASRAYIRKALAFFAIGLFAYAITYWLSPGYVMSGYAVRLAPFAVFFVFVLPAVATAGLIIAGRRFIARLSMVVFDQELQGAGRFIALSCMALAIGAPIVLWVRTQIYYERLFPPDHVSFIAKALASPQFRNATFAVNNYAAVVAYYAGTWAYMDMTIRNAEVDSRMERRHRNSSVWFADWKSNPAYGKASFYVCMKPQTYDSVLAQSDPKHFGYRYEFCGGEPILAHNSPFEDRLVASDSNPPRYWAVVALAPAARPRIVDVITSPERTTGGLTVGYDVKAATNSAYPVQSVEVELLTAPSVYSCSDVQGMHRVAEKADGEKFQLTTSFAGLLSVRARVKSEAGYSDWVDGDIWISFAGEANPDDVLRCPEIIVDGSFGQNGLHLQDEGWSSPESWGTWSDGKHASLLPIPLREAVRNKELFLQADILPFIAKPGQTQVVNVLANGRVVANWLFAEANPHRTATAIIPRQAFADSNDLSLSFEIPEAASPVTYGLSSDTRKLGIGIKHIAIREISLLPLRSLNLTFPVHDSTPTDSYPYVAAGWANMNGTSLGAIDQSASLLFPSPVGTVRNAAIVISADVSNRLDGSRASIEVAVNGHVLGQLANGDASTRFSLSDDILAFGQTLLIEFKDIAGPHSDGPLPLQLKRVRLDSAP